MGKEAPVIGLLGGIGAGKSTAARCFERLGCGLIDADSIAHRVLEEPAVIEKLSQCFGPAVVGEDGRIDRKKLASAVFDSKEKVQELNRIVHPAVLARCETLLEAYQRQGVPVVVDMPLLTEVGWDRRCDVLVYVDCSEEIRSLRNRQQRHLEAEEQKKRENFQISLDKKKQMAHYILTNNSEESELAKQVEKVFSAIQERRRLSVT
ncbi:MAG TPA: dephospho-CoA kinase [Anaerohalosphaeraceae bacterium]|nr:dephospho-CoA kinase [Anaerohalosphaeraceae bacterium]HOL89744.1 dephospho-CoA kinase [Anaerohalosphaeraceae bacterium]HPP57347.1 dephospho-CoA kinase [Anaerohalosphaeraceae bacterium]